MDTNIVLISKDLKQFIVSYKVAKNSLLVDIMLEGMSEKELEMIEVPISNVDSDTLIKVIQFLEHIYEFPMEDIPKPIKSDKMIENVNEWHANFIDQQSQDDIFALILAANFMDIKSLLDLGCSKVATMIKGKTPEEIRLTFNVDEQNQELVE